jgi:haloacid dehalogenase-like hydrolase
VSSEIHGPAAGQSGKRRSAPGPVFTSPRFTNRAWTVRDPRMSTPIRLARALKFSRCGSLTAFEQLEMPSGAPRSIAADDSFQSKPGTSIAATDISSPAVWREPQLVIFDCDGVLVDSEVISNRVLAEMLSAEGLPTTLMQARRDYQGLPLADILSRAEEKLDRALPRDWLARYETERAAAFHRELEPVAGAAETVQRVLNLD